MNDRSSRGSAPIPAVADLLDAVEKIFANEAPSTVSMRTIAAEAGCSLGFPYNHFSSRNELLGAALDRMAKRIAAAATDTEDPRDALLASLDSMRSNAAFSRLVTWLVLEGEDVSGVMSGHPLIQGIAAVAAERRAEDPASVAMTMGLLAIGTITYGPMLNGVAGREPDDGRLSESVTEMFAGWFPQLTD